MNLLNYDEFKDYYHENKQLPLGIYSSPKGLNDKQLKQKYKKYTELYAKRQQYVGGEDQAKWVKVRTEVYERDFHMCRLWKVLSLEERKEAKKNGFGGKFTEITPAHFVRRSLSKKLAMNPDNIYTLSLMFHSNLDDYKHPLNGKPISKEELMQWWKRIINNDDLYNKLIEEGGLYGG